VNASCRNFLQMIRKFTDFFTESADEAADWLRGFAYKFQRQEVEARAALALHRDRERTVARGSVRGSPQDLQRRGRETSSQRVVFIDNAGGTPLRLRGISVDGKLLIACTGDVELNDVTLADPLGGLLTIQCDGTMRVLGRVEASLIPRATFIPAAGVHISGNLILDQIDNRGAMRGSWKTPCAGLRTRSLLFRRHRKDESGI